MISEIAKPSSTQYPLISVIDGKYVEDMPSSPRNEILSETEILSHMNQLDSIDEAGIDAVLVIPECEEDDFVFL